jgi:hypothetical protein
MTSGKGDARVTGAGGTAERLHHGYAPFDAQAKHRTARWTAQALKARVEHLIAKELLRCEASMTPAQWRAHREWVTADVVEAARLWLRERSARGQL